MEQIQDRDRILAALNAPSLDPRRTVILETDPEPRPAPDTPPGTVRLLSTDSNSLMIAADLPRPMLLLITDAYSRYWRAVSMPGSIQSEYQVMPTDYMLMVVPMAAGHHVLRLEYAPPEGVIGRWISPGALLTYLLAATILAVRQRRPGTSASVAPGLQAIHSTEWQLGYSNKGSAKTKPAASGAPRLGSAASL